MRNESMTGWRVCPGDVRWVQVPGIVKPINCGSADRARLIAVAPDAHEANKSALMVLCALEKANDWHPNMEKDIAFAIEACRAAMSKAAA